MKRIRYVSISMVLCLCAFCFGCGGDKVPGDVVKPEKMASFLEEAYLLEGFYAVETDFRYDTLHPEMLASYDSLLARHHLSREDFERSVTWYTHHPEIYETIHDTVIARLDRRQ